MNRRDLEKVHVAIPRLVDELESGKLNRREFLRTTTLLGLSATSAYAVAGAITGEGVVSTAQAQGQMGGTLKVSMFVQDISDPAIFDWSEKGNIARQVIEPMTQVGTDNITRPYLAEGWEANDDLTEWTFRLRKDAVWNNGDTFSAEDVIATFERWLDPATGSSNQGRFSSLTTTSGDSTVMAPGAITKIDDNTVRFRLSSPNLSLPESMGDYPALITHRNFAADGANLIANPIGTGPFELKEHSVGERAVLTKRDPSQYWGDEVYLDGITYIDHGDDPAAGLAALASGQVDLMDRLNVEQVTAVGTIPTLDLYETVTGQTGVARMRVTEAPFDNLKLRQAILACIDHARVLELAYQGLGAVGEDHHVSPIHPEYATLPMRSQDYDKARSLLAEAGYPNGLDLSIDCVASPTWESATCQVIAEMLKPANIRLSVNIMPGGTYWDRWMSAPFGFTAWTHRPLGVQVLGLAYRSGVAWNETAYSNPEFDALLSRAEGLLDVDARREVMAEIQALLQHDSIIAQPFWRAIHTAGSKRVNGFSLHPAYENHFNRVWLS